MKKFKDNSKAPIIAFDFDGTITTDANTFPECGNLRPYAKEVINFLMDIGVNVVIYTSRDTAIVQESLIVVDHITPMVRFLNINGIRFSSINKSIQFASFHYNSRKIYAHMYIDDRAFGWNLFGNSKYTLIYALATILEDILGISGETVDTICGAIVNANGNANDYILYNDLTHALRDYIEEYWNK